MFPKSGFKVLAPRLAFSQSSENCFPKMDKSFISLLILNKFGIKKFAPYLFIGIFLWFFTHGSGIHSTISGVLLAATIPHRKHEKDYSLLLKIEHILQ